LPVTLTHSHLVAHPKERVWQDSNLWNRALYRARNCQGCCSHACLRENRAGRSFGLKSIPYRVHDAPCHVLGWCCRDASRAPSGRHCGSSGTGQLDLRMTVSSSVCGNDMHTAAHALLGLVCGFDFKPERLDGARDCVGRGYRNTYGPSGRPERFLSCAATIPQTARCIRTL